MLQSLNVRERVEVVEWDKRQLNQLNHYFISTLEELNYDCAIIHVGINDILGSRDMSELKVGRTCQSYSVGKVHVSPILPST